MTRIQRRIQQNQEIKTGATQASHERQDDRVSPGTPNQQNKPDGGTDFICQISLQRIHEDVDGNTTTHAHYVHDNAEDNNNDNVAATNGDNRPELHVHVGQAGDQSLEKVDDDKKEGQGGVENPEFDADVSNPSIDAPAIIVEGDNNEDDGAMPLAPMITPPFNSKDLYKVLGVPMNATDWQIKSSYHILAKLHHPDCQPINLSKDDANRTLAFINNAYGILGNIEKRRVHDASLRIGEAGDSDEEYNDDEDIDDDEDSDDDDDSNGDGVRPPEEASTSCACNWAHVFNFCYCP
jgi:hypothetical protein